MISRSRLWSNFLHWRTNQLLSFHKFPQEIIASCCSHSYPQGWRTVTVLVAVIFDLEKQQHRVRPNPVYQRSPLEEGRPRPTINMVGIICSATLSGRGTLTGSSLQNLNSSSDWLVLQVMTSLWLLARVEMSQPTMSSTVESKAQTQLLL